MQTSIALSLRNVLTTSPLTSRVRFSSGINKRYFRTVKNGSVVVITTGHPCIFTFGTRGNDNSSTKTPQNASAVKKYSQHIQKNNCHQFTDDSGAVVE